MGNRRVYGELTEKLPRQKSKCWISDAFSGPPACSGYLGVLRPSKRTPHELLEDD